MNTTATLTTSKPSTGWTYRITYNRSNGESFTSNTGLNRADARSIKASLKLQGFTNVQIVREQDGVTIR